MEPKSRQQQFALSKWSCSCRQKWGNFQTLTAQTFAGLQRRYVKGEWVKGIPQSKGFIFGGSHKAKTAAVPRHIKWCCCCHSHFLAIILYMLNFFFSFSPGFHLACCIKIIKFCSIFFFLFFPEPYLQWPVVILQLAPAIYGLVQLFNSPHKYGAHAY